MTRQDETRSAAWDQRYEAVRGRLRRYADGDDEAVRAVEALKDVGALLGFADTDLDARRACGLLLWCRSTHQPAGDDHDDLVSALALLEPVWRADPSRLPEEIADYFAEFGAGPIKPTDAWQGPALALAAHVKRTGDTEAAAIAVELLRRIVATAPVEDPERNMYLANLAMAVQEQAELTGSADGFDEAIAVGRLAMAAFRETDRRRAVPMGATAVALRRRSARTGNLADLDEAVVLGRAAAELSRGTDRGARLSNLGVALTYRYQWTGDPADLDLALAAHRDAVAAGEPGDARRAVSLTNLAAALLVAFEDGGTIGTLTKALTAIDEAAATLSAIDEVAGAPGAVGTIRSAVHSGLCNLLRTRFRYTGNSFDLDRAVDAGRTALAALPPGHPDRASALTNLALARHARSRRRSDVDDLDRAIAELSAAVEITDGRDPDLAGRLSNLCDALLSRADRGGPSAGMDVAAAVEHGQAAVRAGAHHRRRAVYLSNLGNARLAQHDLDGAIAVFEQAVEASPEDASALANLALARLTRYQATGPDDDLDRAIAGTRRAARVTTAPIEVRIRAAIRWGYWAAAAERWAEALAGYDTAVDLLAEVSPRDLPRDDQEFELTRLGGVAGDAAACALRAGDDRAAVRLLERGRGIVLAHALPEATRPGGTIDDGLPAAGPVVLVNVSRFGSHALVLTAGGVRIRALPGLDPDTVRTRADQFLAALADRDSADAEAATANVLGWLWDAVAGPVLDLLGFTGQPPLPRLWWCPTGLLAILPLHAAGRKGSGSVPDRVISSTTPSLWALARARRAEPSGGAGRLLVIAPAGQALPAARAELRLLRDLFPGQTVTSANPDPAAIGAYRRVHVAGHAVADLTNPSRGGIVRDGRPPVTADDLSRLRRPDGELAFLSACETARTSPALADETVHLASVLHVAGYRHVVATLWTVADRPALRVARNVYTDLAAHGDVDRIPAALHATMLALRDRYPNHPLAWAAYVHMGP